jgi:hypothetical protein
MRDLHLTLPEPVYKRLHAEAERAHIPETAFALLAIERALGPNILSRIRDIFHLDPVELAALFSVDALTLCVWDERGVPSEYQPKLAAIAAIGELLERKLSAGAVPGVARTPAPAYGGNSMLGMIAANEHDALLADVRASFDWSATA